MRGYNHITIVGNCGHDPEDRYMPNGEAVLNFAVYEDRSTDDKTDSQIHRVVVFGKHAEAIAKILKKGSPVTVTGELRHSNYVDKENIKRDAWKIYADYVRVFPLSPKNQVEVEKSPSVGDGA